MCRKLLPGTGVKLEALTVKIKLKQDAQVMLTTNLIIEDRLINGQMVTVSKIKYSDTSQSNIHKI